MRVDRRGLTSWGVALACAVSVQTAPRPALAKPAKDARFALSIPDGFAPSPRKATTGTIYVAGDFPRFAVVSVTAWPIRELLAAEMAAASLPGLPAPSPPSAADATSAPSFAALGAPEKAVLLLLRARDREASAGALESTLLSSKLEEAKLRFEFDTPLPVSDPDALFEQRGVRQLIRRTTATSTIGSVAVSGGGGGVRAEPAVITVWGSALAQDFEKDLGGVLRDSVSSFDWLGE